MAKHWVTKIDITQIFFDKIVQNFQDMRKIDVRKGIRSFASISVTKRKLFTKNRGGGSDPTPPPGGRGLKENVTAHLRMSFYLLMLRGLAVPRHLLCHGPPLQTVAKICK